MSTVQAAVELREGTGQGAETDQNESLLLFAGKIFNTCTIYILISSLLSGTRVYPKSPKW